jgi:hypothetical protein
MLKKLEQAVKDGDEMLNRINEFLVEVKQQLKRTLRTCFTEVNKYSNIFLLLSLFLASWSLVIQSFAYKSTLGLVEVIFMVLQLYATFLIGNYVLCFVAVRGHTLITNLIDVQIMKIKVVKKHAQAKARYARLRYETDVVDSIVSRANSFQVAFCGTQYTNGSTASPSLRFGVYGGVSNNSSNKMTHSRRAAEAGYWRSGQNRPWTQYHSQVYGATTGCTGDTTSNDYSFYNYQTTTVATQRIYYRSNIFDGTTPDMNFNAVIKGIPISATYVPCPYYLPDDIVLIDFYYPQSSAFIAQFDTVTISPTEVYTVIDASYNQDGATRGILLCGRIV